MPNLSFRGKLEFRKIRRWILASDGVTNKSALPHAIAVTTAYVTDRKGTLLALGRCAADLQTVQRILADGWYVGQPFALAVDDLLGAEVDLG